MSLELILPNIETLNPSQPDYVAKLDEGIVLIQTASAELEKYEKGKKKITEYLKEKGFKSDIKSTTVETAEFRRTVANVDIRLENQDELNRIEKIFKEYFEEEKEAEKQRFLLDKATDDFYRTAYNLTKKELLNENLDSRLFHFYLANPNGVYEFNLDMEQKKHSDIIKNDKIDPELFNDEKYVLDFKNKSKGAKANAYLLTNPSKKMPHEIILVHCANQEMFEFMMKLFRKDIRWAESQRDTLNQIKNRKFN